MIFGDSKNDLCLNKRVHIFEIVLDKGYSLCLPTVGFEEDAVL